MTPDETAGLGTGPGEATPMSSDQAAHAPTANQPSALVVPGATAVATPIVVRNELWSAADPAAYEGGRPTDITHLAEVEASGIASHDDAGDDPVIL